MEKVTYTEIGTPICKDYTYTTSKGTTSQKWRLYVVEQANSLSDETQIAIKKCVIGEKDTLIFRDALTIPLSCKDWLGETLTKMQVRKVASKMAKASTEDLKALLETVYKELQIRTQEGK